MVGYGPLSGRAHTPSWILLGVAAASAVLLVLPPQGGAGRVRTIARLRADDAALAAKARSAVLQLYALDARLGGARDDLAALEARLQQLQGEQLVVAHQLRLAALDNRLSEQRVATRLRYLYDYGTGASSLDVVLGASSLDQVLTRLDDVNAVAAANQSVVTQLDSARTRLAGLAADLEARKLSLVATTQAVGATVAELGQAQAGRSAYLTSLESRRAYDAAAISHLNAEAQAAVARSLQLAARACARTSRRRARGAGATRPHAGPSRRGHNRRCGGDERRCDRARPRGDADRRRAVQRERDGDPVPERGRRLGPERRRPRADRGRDRLRPAGEHLDGPARRLRRGGRRPVGDTARHTHGHPRLRRSDCRRHGRVDRRESDRPLVSHRCAGRRVGQANRDRRDRPLSRIPAPAGGILRGMAARVVVAGVAVVSVLLAAAGASGANLRALDRDIAASLAVPGVVSRSSTAEVVDLSERQGRVRTQPRRCHSSRPRTRSSRTTYAALIELGAAYRFPTEVLGEGVRDGSDLARQPRAQRLRRSVAVGAGARRARASWCARRHHARSAGSMLGDASYFDTRPYGAGLAALVRRAESPPLSALIVDRGARGRFVAHPALAAAVDFTRSCTRRHPVAGGPRSGTATPQAVVLATIYSPPLAEILTSWTSRATTSPRRWC